MLGFFLKYVFFCVDWFDDLREIILGYYVFVKGGLEVDGELISDINENEILEYCEEIKKRGIISVVVNGVFSFIDIVER